jgi:hypothetical protein
MAILKQVEIYWVKVDPEKPAVNTFDVTKKAPKRWEIQVQTKSKAIRTEWKELGINVRPVRKDKTDEESEITHYVANFSKNATNKEGKPNPPVQVVDAKNRDFTAVNTIGNGSIANLRLSRRDYKDAKGADKVGWTLMGIQLLKLKPYTAQTEDFEDNDEETEILENEEPEGEAHATGKPSDSDEY